MLGQVFRETRRKANEAALDRVRRRLEMTIQEGHPVAELICVLHREVSAQYVALVGIDHSDHPEYASWKSLKAWGEQNGLTLSLRQQKTSTNGNAVVTAVPSRARKRPGRQPATPLPTSHPGAPSPYETMQ